MKFRISYYRKAEVVAGRAPRYMVDIEADTIDEVKQTLKERLEPGVKPSESAFVIRSIYKAPDTPIRSTPSYVFEDSAARNKWYSSHKSTQSGRLCHECRTVEVERYKRICKTCRAKREEADVKPCSGCGEPIATLSRKRYCDKCATGRKESQEKTHREKRAKQNTVDRIKTQVAWAVKHIPSTSLLNCKLASRFQGLRLPHVTNKNTRCRTCLQKFIDVQTVYLNNLMVEEQTAAEIAETFNSLYTEPTNVHSHAANA